MSFSKATERCGFCDANKAMYTCPKCCVKYCSSECYRSKEHVQCSELFFRDWVLSSLENKNATKEAKNQMLGILKRAAQQDSDDDDSEDGDSAEPSLEERIADINLNKDFDEKILWERLTKEERDDFEALLKEKKVEGILPIKKPWWTLSKVNLVEDITSGSEGPDDLVSKHPAFPVGIKSLSSLTSTPAADCVKYSVISTLYCYVCIMRYYNFEVGDFIEEAVDNILYLAPVLSAKRNYLSPEEVVQDLTRLLISSKFNLPVEVSQFVTQDVCAIINGPSNTQPNYYTLCALSDLRNLISGFCPLLNSLPLTKELKKSKNKKILSAIKKIEYLISWSQENDSRLKHLVPKLQLLFLSDIVSDIH